MEKQFFVYILASGLRGTIYIGVTSNLQQRAWQHRTKQVEGFTKQHEVSNLVWYEAQPSAEAAITREKHLKKWNRAWKIELIEATNPHWQDLYDGLFQ